MGQRQSSSCTGRYWNGFRSRKVVSETGICGYDFWKRMCRYWSEYLAHASGAVTQLAPGGQTHLPFCFRLWRAPEKSCCARTVLVPGLTVVLLR